MPWTGQNILDLRMCLVAAHRRGEAPLSALCARDGISRKTGYKWLERYGLSGAPGLSGRSRSRHTQTLSIEPETAAALLALRGQRPAWGPRKFLARLSLDHPGLTWPAGHGGRPAAPGGRFEAAAA